MRRFLNGPTAILTVVFLIAGCSSSDGAADETTTTSAREEAAAPVDTAGTPTSESTGETESEIIEVTFDGNECTVAGPTELPPWDHHAFVLTDASDLGAVLFARKLTGGHTYQDVLDAQEEAGGPGSYWRRPSWVASALGRPDLFEVDLADNQGLVAVTLEPGNHYFLALYTTTGPEGIWLCAPVDVVES
jgi:hypothetical protein